MKFFPPNIETSVLKDSSWRMVFVTYTSWCVLQFASEKSWLGCWDDHEAKLHGFTRHFAIVCSPCHFTMKDNNLEGIWIKIIINEKLTGIFRFRLYRLYPWWLEEVEATCWAQSQTETKLKRNLFSVRHQGTTDHGVETIQFWDPILTTRWPWRSWAAHFWSQDMHLFRAPLARNPLLDVLGSLPQRPLSQAEETFAWWEGKQTRGNHAVPWALSKK